ncbi:coiled-coil domain-containing protein [Aurantivibrio plasticivorans]
MAHSWRSRVSRPIVYKDHLILLPIRLSGLITRSNHQEIPTAILNGDNQSGVNTMGLFSRSNPIDDDSSDQFEEIELPSSSDIQDNVFNEDDSKLDLPVAPPSVKTQQSKLGYGIEDAIGLMKALPRDNNEVVVTVVKKTLESTNIQVEHIIEDANSKEDRIRTKHKSLEEEIKQLEQQIAQRNQQISELLQDLKETTDVRQRLELALNLDKKSAPKRAAPEEAKPEAPADSKNMSAESDTSHAQRPQAASDTQAQPQNRRADPVAQQAARRRQSSERSTSTQNRH